MNRFHSSGDSLSRSGVHCAEALRDIARHCLRLRQHAMEAGDGQSAERTMDLQTLAQELLRAGRCRGEREVSSLLPADTPRSTAETQGTIDAVMQQLMNTLIAIQTALGLEPDANDKLVEKFSALQYWAERQGRNGTLLMLGIGDSPLSGTAS